MPSLRAQQQSCLYAQQQQSNSKYPAAICDNSAFGLSVGIVYTD